MMGVIINIIISTGILICIYLSAKTIIWDEIIAEKIYNAVQLYNSDLCKEYIETHRMNTLCCSDCNKSDVCYRLNNERGIIEDTEECEICFAPDERCEIIEYSQIYKKTSIKTIFSWRIKDIIEEEVYNKIEKYI